jgi:hypothetical protein
VKAFQARTENPIAAGRSTIGNATLGVVQDVPIHRIRDCHLIAARINKWSVEPENGNRRMQGVTSSTWLKVPTQWSWQSAAPPGGPSYAQRVDGMDAERESPARFGGMEALIALHSGFACTRERRETRPPGHQSCQQHTDETKSPDILMRRFVMMKVNHVRLKHLSLTVDLE